MINEFRSAPIKKLERCIEKTETDYMNESFPQSSKLIDIIRCSLSFSSLNNLLKTINHIHENVNENKF